MPAIVLAILAIFSEILSDFGMAATIARSIDFRLLTYHIYTAANDYPVNFALAGTQSLVLLAMTAAVVIADRILRRQRSFRLISGRARAVRIVDLGVWRWPLAGSGLLVTLLAVVLPIVAIALRAISRTLGQGLVEGNLTSRFVLEVMSLDHPSNAALMRSMGFASLTAVVAVLAAVLMAYRLERGNTALRPVVMAISLGTIAIPGIVLGFGYILMWDRLPGFRDLPIPVYGNGSLLVTGYVAAGLPYALVILLAAMGQISPNLIDAARLHGASPTVRLTRIVMPLIAVSILTASLFVFVRTVFELPISQLLMPKSGPPAPALIVRLFGNDDDGIGSALSLFSMLAAGTVAAIAWLVGTSLFGRHRSISLARLAQLSRNR
jgi:iron(III) transport system permease protein